MIPTLVTEMDMTIDTMTAMQAVTFDTEVVKIPTTVNRTMATHRTRTPGVTIIIIIDRIRIEMLMAMMIVTQTMEAVDLERISIIEVIYF